MGICSPIPLLRSFMRSGGSPIPTSSSAEVAVAPNTFEPWSCGHGWLSSCPAQTPHAFWEETMAEVSSQGGGTGESQCGASSSISPPPSTRGGQQEQGHTYRRGLETCELNLVNSPGAVHSVPSWGKEGGVHESTGDTVGQADTRPKPHVSVRTSPPPPSGTMPCCREALQEENMPRALPQGLLVPSWWHSCHENLSLANTTEIPKMRGCDDRPWGFPLWELTPRKSRSKY